MGAHLADETCVGVHVRRLGADGVRHVEVGGELRVRCEAHEAVAALRRVVRRALRRRHQVLEQVLHQQQALVELHVADGALGDRRRTLLKNS